MAGSFDQRKQSFENKYAHDEQLKFKVEARCCKLVGLWAAEQMGLDQDEAQAYAREVVSANLEEAGFEDIKRKMRPDFEAKGVEITDHMLDSMIEKYFEQAKVQVMEEAEK